MAPPGGGPVVSGGSAPGAKGPREPGPTGGAPGLVPTRVPFCGRAGLLGRLFEHAVGGETCSLGGVESQDLAQHVVVVLAERGARCGCSRPGRRTGGSRCARSRTAPCRGARGRRSGRGGAAAGPTTASPRSATGTASMPSACNVAATSAAGRGGGPAGDEGLDGVDAPAPGFEGAPAVTRRRRRGPMTWARRAHASSSQAATATQRSSPAHAKAPWGTARTERLPWRDAHMPVDVEVEDPRGRASTRPPRPGSRRGARRARCAGGRAVRPPARWRRNAARASR